MSSTKTNEEMLKNIKQFNKTARETRAQNLGFKNASDLILYLKGEVLRGRGSKLFSPTGSPATKTVKLTKSSGTTKQPKAKVITDQVRTVVGKKSGNTPTIHVADILDSSGSMHGGKIEAAIVGINMGVEGLKKETANVKFTYTLCDFSDDVIFRHLGAKLSDVDNFEGDTRGSTALYDAIGQTIAQLKERVTLGDKVLINIYTDGQENASRKFKAADIAVSIKVLSENNWTFTFIGTKSDVAYAQSNLHFHESNTLVHDNTPKGMAGSFVANTAARSTYSQKVSLGEDVSKGFYKDIN